MDPDGGHLYGIPVFSGRFYMCTYGSWVDSAYGAISLTFSSSLQLSFSLFGPALKQDGDRKVELQISLMSSSHASEPQLPLFPSLVTFNARQKLFAVSLWLPIFIFCILCLGWAVLTWWTADGPDRNYGILAAEVLGIEQQWLKGSSVGLKHCNWSWKCKKQFKEKVGLIFVKVFPRLIGSTLAFSIRNYIGWLGTVKETVTNQEILPLDKQAWSWWISDLA